MVINIKETQKRLLVSSKEEIFKTSFANIIAITMEIVWTVGLRKNYIHIYLYSDVYERYFDE